MQASFSEDITLHLSQKSRGHFYARISVEGHFKGFKGSIS